jgi:hypothetical protein
MRNSPHTDISRMLLSSTMHPYSAAFPTLTSGVLLDAADLPVQISGTGISVPVTYRDDGVDFRVQGEYRFGQFAGNVTSEVAKLRFLDLFKGISLMSLYLLNLGWVIKYPKNRKYYFHPRTLIWYCREQLTVH